MTLGNEDRWIWDFWLVADGDVHHCFYLQAPRSIGDPEQRHWNSSIGHAVSTDLQVWEIVEDALTTGKPGAFDDLSTWTGSVIRHTDEWAMLYTGTTRAEDGLIQRIGLATSDDLHQWSRQPTAVLDIDPERYEVLDLSMWHDQAWRDPWLVVHPGDPAFYALFTARANTGPRFDRGVIGRARSEDLRNWEVLDPLPMPKGFGQLEVPQLVRLEHRWYLLFSSDVETQSPERRAGPGTGTYYLVADSPDGPFEMIGDGALEVDPVGSAYAGRIHHKSAGDPWFLSWERTGPDGDFVGRIGAARPVVVGRDGSLALGVPSDCR